MFLSLNQVLDLIKATPKSRNFVEGEKIINAGHLIYNRLENQNNDQYDILSYCIQSSAFRDKPHEIKTVIQKNSQIVSSKCSCTAGLSERCKHITAVLLYCTRHDISQMKISSCTDNKCLWNAPQKACLEQYDANPLSHHKCYQTKENEKEFSDDVRKTIKELIFSKDLESTLSVHVYGINIFNEQLMIYNSIHGIKNGRHDPVKPSTDPLPPDYLLFTENLFKHQSSLKILTELSKESFKLSDCCFSKVNNLFDKDPYYICIESRLGSKIF
ncbi:hypothetical protein KQX54_005665 [Cotesia glomerata]|uniref:SWIM-type domain-containing protein n=1 Tax=Cotesia glomerata TaxID=32391 RepID=A0AAV7HRY7_COTGL|nr:hypothetical protein KQX54_005665 [Cotesia glomerata]